MRHPAPARLSRHRKLELCHEQAPTPNGGYQAWVWADPDSVTNDSFPGNNQVGPFPYTVAVPDDNPDLLVVESTYGNRSHPEDPVGQQLAELLRSVEKSRGTMLVASFAVGRAQQLIYLLRQATLAGVILRERTSSA